MRSFGQDDANRLVVIGAFDCGVEAAREHILPDLPVPLAGHRLLKPLGKPGKLGSRKAGNNRFKFFETHGRRILLGLAGEKKCLRDFMDACGSANDPGTCGGGGFHTASDFVEDWAPG